DAGADAPDVGDVGSVDADARPEDADSGSNDVDTAPPVPDGGEDGDGGPPDGEPLEGGSDGDSGPPGPCPNPTRTPPAQMCPNGHCLDLSQLSVAARSGLVLWLDTSNLGSIGSEVSVWCDQSGNGNDAYSFAD